MGRITLPAGFLRKLAIEGEQDLLLTRLVKQLADRLHKEERQLIAGEPAGKQGA